MPIQTKRIYDALEPEDGHRVLVDRLWPRGVSKEDAALDEWVQEIAPSASLRAWYGHDLERWDEFRKRYRDELDGRADLIERLCKLAADNQVTLLYAAADREHNNAIVLANYLREH